MSISRKAKEAFGVRGKRLRYRMKTFLRWAIETPDGFRAKCWICGRMITYEEMTTDHITRKREGGKENPKNLKPACLTCNQKRG